MSNDQVKQLVINIVRAKKAYYNGNPIMSDAAYDGMEDMLKAIDKDHPILYAVGYDESYDWWLRHYE